MTDEQEEQVRMVDVGELTTQDCAHLAHAFEGTATSIEQIGKPEQYQRVVGFVRGLAGLMLRTAAVKGLQSTSAQAGDNEGNEIVN